MSPDLSNLFIALVGVFGGGGLVAFLTLPQQRRRIAAGASKTETDAAATLSDIQLKWVTEARDEARAARAETAEVRGRMVEQEAQYHREVRELRTERDELRDEVVALRAQVDRLTRLLHAAGLDVPPSMDPRRGGLLPESDDQA